MLTTIELENFNGIAKRQRIDFTQLTLLFGANNAGGPDVLGEDASLAAMTNA